VTHFGWLPPITAPLAHKPASSFAFSHPFSFSPYPLTACAVQPAQRPQPFTADVAPTNLYVLFRH
jgi:hypothetical protein